MDLCRKDILFLAGVIASLLALSLIGWLSFGEAILVVTLGISVGVVLFLQLVIYRKLQKSNEWQREQQRGIYHQLRERAKQDYRQIEALSSMMQFVKLNRPLPPMRNWAISPDMNNIIISEILNINPAVIVECGSGTSTIIAAYVLMELERGKLYSLENEQEYADKNQRLLEAHGLSDRAEVVYAPLIEVTLGEKTWLWYENRLPPDMPSIDLLIVDGPLGSIHEMARYPAVPMLYGLLSPSATIIVDDTIRKDEREIVKAWMEEFGDLECQWMDTEKGTAVLRRKPHSHKGGKKEH